MKQVMVIGVGGIGGLVTAPLVKAYDAQISLVEPGPRRDSMLTDGLTLHSDTYGELTVHPASVVTSPSELTSCDVILVCVKNTALEAVISSLNGSVREGAVIVPLMNGVRAYGRLQEAFPQAIVLPSVIYTISYVQEDGSIVQKGNFTTIYIGSTDEARTGMQVVKDVQQLFLGAGIDCRISEDVLAEVWHKYILNCAYNVVDTRWDCTAGDIRKDKAKLEDYTALMEECAALARAKGIAIAPDIIRRHLFQLMKTTADSTSSLHRDFANKNAGELEVFSGDVVHMAREEGLSVPVSERYYKKLGEIALSFS